MERLVGLIPLTIAGGIFWAFIALIKWTFTITLANATLGTVFICILAYALSGISLIIFITCIIMAMMAFFGDY